jgi:hypothetical protein
LQHCVLHCTASQQIKRVHVATALSNMSSDRCNFCLQLAAVQRMLTEPAAAGRPTGEAAAQLGNVAVDALQRKQKPVQP